MVRAGAAKVVAESAGRYLFSVNGAKASFVAEHECPDTIGEMFATEAKGANASGVAKAVDIPVFAETSRSASKLGHELPMGFSCLANDAFESFDLLGESFVGFFLLVVLCGDIHDGLS